MLELLPKNLLAVLKNFGRVCPDIIGHAAGVLKQYSSIGIEQNGHAIRETLAGRKFAIIVLCEGFIGICPDIVLIALLCNPCTRCAWILKPDTNDRDTQSLEIVV